jgi:hypothetical protein
LSDFGYAVEFRAWVCVALQTRVASGAGYGAIGAATSAALSPWLFNRLYPGSAPLTTDQVAAITALATLAGGGLVWALGQNAIEGATAAQNEALNNSTDDVGSIPDDPLNELLEGGGRAGDPVGYAAADAAPAYAGSETGSGTRVIFS